MGLANVGQTEVRTQSRSSVAICTTKGMCAKSESSSPTKSGNGPPLSRDQAVGTRRPLLSAGSASLPLRQLFDRLAQMGQEEVLDRTINLGHLQVIVNGDVADNRYMRVPPSLFGIQVYFADRNLPRLLLGDALKDVWLEEEASVGEIEDSTDRTRIFGSTVSHRVPENFLAFFEPRMAKLMNHFFTPLSGVANGLSYDGDPLSPCQPRNTRWQS